MGSAADEYWMVLEDGSHRLTSTIIGAINHDCQLDEMCKEIGMKNPFDEFYSNSLDAVKELYYFEHGEEMPESEVPDMPEHGEMFEADKAIGSFNRLIQYFTGLRSKMWEWYIENKEVVDNGLCDDENIWPNHWHYTGFIADDDGQYWYDYDRDYAPEKSDISFIEKVLEYLTEV